jgi:hypothetical protein
MITVYDGVLSQIGSSVSDDIHQIYGTIQIGDKIFSHVTVPLCLDGYLRQASTSGSKTKLIMFSDSVLTGIVVDGKIYLRLNGLRTDAVTISIMIFRGIILLPLFLYGLVDLHNVSLRLKINKAVDNLESEYPNAINF